jgi:hypothetical protein
VDAVGAGRSRLSGFGLFGFFGFFDAFAFAMRARVGAGRGLATAVGGGSAGAGAGAAGGDGGGGVGAGSGEEGGGGAGSAGAVPGRGCSGARGPAGVGIGPPVADPKTAPAGAMEDGLPTGGDNTEVIGRCLTAGFAGGAASTRVTAACASVSGTVGSRSPRRSRGGTSSERASPAAAATRPMALGKVGVIATTPERHGECARSSHSSPLPIRFLARRIGQHRSKRVSFAPWSLLRNFGPRCLLFLRERGAKRAP